VWTRAGGACHVCVQSLPSIYIYIHISIIYIYIHIYIYIYVNAKEGTHTQLRFSSDLSVIGSTHYDFSQDSRRSDSSVPAPGVPPVPSEDLSISMPSTRYGPSYLPVSCNPTCIIPRVCREADVCCITVVSDSPDVSSPASVTGSAHFDFSSEPP